MEVAAHVFDIKDRNWATFASLSVYPSVMWETVLARKINLNPPIANTAIIAATVRATSNSSKVKPPCEAAMEEYLLTPIFIVELYCFQRRQRFRRLFIGSGRMYGHLY